jgi:hypothetical protein
MKPLVREGFIGSMQEGIHTLKTMIPCSVIKIDLSKAYDNVSWLYLTMIFCILVSSSIW